MAITRAQQAKQMLQDGGMLVKPGFGGTRQGYRGPGGYRGGPGGSAGKGKEDKKESGISPGQSMAQFGHAGHGGKTETEAKAHQQLGIDRPDSGPGSNPNAGQTKEEAAGYQRQQEINKQIQEGTFKPPKKKSVLDNLTKFVPPTRKLLYNIFPNNPKNELDYLRSLPASQRALLSPALQAKLEELEDAEKFDDYTGFDTKFTFDEFEDLRKFQPTEGLNFAEYAAKYKGAPGLLYSGDVGNLEKYVSKRDAEGRPLEYGYRQRTGDGPDPIIFPQNNPNDPGDGDGDGDGEDDDNTNREKGLAFRFMNRGGMPMDAPTEGGIMDLETGRQMYFLGKLVKKATRAVKKIVKSPIGKAALLYAGTGGLGNLASGKAFFSNFMSPTNFLAKKNLSNIFTRKGIGNILLGGKTPFGERARDFTEFSGLFGKGGKFGLGQSAFALSMLLPFLSDEEKQQLEMNRGPSIDPGYIRGNPYTFASQVGSGRGMATAFLAEGGKPEPVAKKTMPLLDMGGKEMDFREDGGFVPIGRMERADDVPARLSKNEFVFTADAVRNAGDGDIDKGAEVMYNMMKNLESGGDVSEESQGLEGARRMFQTSKRLEEVL